MKNKINKSLWLAGDMYCNTIHGFQNYKGRPPYTHKHTHKKNFHSKKNRPVFFSPMRWRGPFGPGPSGLWLSLNRHSGMLEGHTGWHRIPAVTASISLPPEIHPFTVRAPLIAKYIKGLQSLQAQYSPLTPKCNSSWNGTVSTCWACHRL